MKDKLIGLSSANAKQHLIKYGFNELPNVKPKKVWQIAWEVLKEPMLGLLIFSGSLYILLGDLTEGIILLASIFLVIFITFYQHQKTEKALEALKKMSSPRVMVIRDGKEVRIAGREVVPDDIIILHEGDRISADAKILTTLNLMVDESMLTGESMPVSKNIEEDDKSIVYSGTLVVQGKGVAKVLYTGLLTKFGKIGVSLESIVHDKTRLQAEMMVLIRNLFFVGGLLSIGVVFAFYYTRGNFIQSLLNGLASAMAILPEEFPVVLTVFLALGAWRLSKINVLTRNPTVIETLGSATVLCTDKTGTITQNKMEISFLYDGNSSFSKDNFLENKPKLSPLITAAMCSSQKDTIDPMEKAIESSFKSLSLPSLSNYSLIKEYPLSKDCFAMTRVLKSNSDQTLLIGVKGAPEAIFKLCRLNTKEIERHLQVVNVMAEQGYRVIGVGMAPNQGQLIHEAQSSYNFQFLGLIGLEDPIRPEVPQAVKQCYEAGIKVIMITGDYPTTAKSIAKQIGLNTDFIITGEELENLDEETSIRRINEATIFARVIPEQKLKIVEALKGKNEIVAMTGDGVNDAPALKASNIGIAMGNSGTDVAREASSLVLLDDNFASIVKAIRSGRRIFDNLQKAMSYIIAIHIPIIGLTLIPALFSQFPVLLMPLHIVFLELIIDPVCSVAYEYEQEEKGIMQRQPRDPNEKFFGANKMIMSIIKGCLLLIMVLAVYFLTLNEGHTNEEVRAITFSALIIGNIFLILTNLSKTRNFLNVFAEKNYPVFIILITALIMLFLILFVPYLQNIFSFKSPGFYHFYVSLICSSLLLFLLEIIKYISNRD